jgi:serine/threonine protein kinase
MHGGHFAERIDLGPRQTMNYLAYRWYSGQTIEHRLGHGPRIAPDEAIVIARQIAQALGQLHRRGIVHRDIKPENLMLCEDGVLRILDLGAAVSGHEPDWMREGHAGTPSYMNPEQWKDAAPDAGSDLFALGVVLYRALTGKLPFGEIEPYQGARYRHDPTPPARLRPDIPIWFDRIVLRAIALDPKQRFETAEEFLLAIDRGAARLLNAPLPTPLIARDPAALWRIVAAMSVLLNVLLVYFLLALPH